MRLTLRTMLAYMDDILEPEDAADIGKKLEESDLAKSIMHRLRDSIRRLRLGAPPPLGNGMGLDPNSVAEYLDNTLPAEQVGEFEKICLESDVHLAEVGACHQILTLVLGEPAEVDAAARERMYHIAARPVAPQAAATPVRSPVSSAAPVAVQSARRAKPEVPDYLRESRSRNWVALVAIVLLMALVSGGIVTALFFHDLRKMVGAGEGEVAANGATPGDTLVADARSTAPPFVENATAAPTGSGNDTAAVEPAAVDGAMPNAQDDETTEEEPEMPADAGLIPDDFPEPDMPAGPAANADVPPAAMAVEGERPAVVAVPQADETPPGEVLGRYFYKQDVLLRMDRRSQLWRRLPASNLAAGDRLMALAAFHPAIALNTEVTIQPVDASRLELLGLDEAGVPTIGLDYGRLVLFTAGKPRNSLWIRMADHQALLTFVDPKATLAINARRQWIPGKDPTASAGPLVADLFVTSGDVIWEEAGARSEWKAPQHAIVDSGGVRIVNTELEKWTRGEPLSRLDLVAAETVEHELTGDQPVSLSVKELLSDRRREVRELGIRAAANVGEFGMLVKMLNEYDQNSKLLWHIEIEALRSAMVRDPETARLILDAFETHRGAEDGPQLYRMLWGYSAEDRAGGITSKLVEYLNHESLDFRVLAFHNLKEITGKGLSYKPEAPARARRSAYLTWKERIKELKPVPPANQ